MIIQMNVNSEIQINKLEDLHKLKLIMEENNLKVNKSQIARELGVDPHTVGKYLNGYIKPTTRNRKSKIEHFEPIIKELLGKDSIQIFYYKRILWQYLKDNYRLDCAQSSFRRYIFSFLDESFQAFGGVPEELLTDNMKTVMDLPRTNYFKGKVNNKFQQFAKDYGFKVHPCVAGRPNTKAKVEARMKLLDEVRAYNGTLNYEQLHKLVSDLNNRINSKCHTSTGKIPILHLQKEKDFLSELPKDQIRNHYKIITTSVKVNSQSMISYKSNQYSVPPEYIGKRLKLQVYDDQLHVYYSTKLVTIHDIQNQKLNYHAEHYAEVSALTFNKSSYEMMRKARQNLNLIGEVYKNE